MLHGRECLSSAACESRSVFRYLLFNRVLGGVRNLRVADASVMPEITSGNTNTPTIMIADKVAREMTA